MHKKYQTHKEATRLVCKWTILVCILQVLGFFLVELPFPYMHLVLICRISKFNELSNISASVYLFVPNIIYGKTLFVPSSL